MVAATPSDLVGVGTGGTGRRHKVDAPDVVGLIAKCLVDDLRTLLSALNSAEEKLNVWEEDDTEGLSVPREEACKTIA